MNVFISRENQRVNGKFQGRQRMVEVCKINFQIMVSVLSYFTLRPKISFIYFHIGVFWGWFLVSFLGSWGLLGGLGSSWGYRKVSNSNVGDKW